MQATDALPDAESRRDEREQMVERQLRARGIRDPRVLQAFREVPRHFFVPPQRAAEAYEDYPIDIGRGQTISQPYMVALMTELLALRGSERVLEVGTGSGYQAAILAKLCPAVYTVERLPDLSRRAQASWRSLAWPTCTAAWAMARWAGPRRRRSTASSSPRRGRASRRPSRRNWRRGGGS